jgi:hypothetical protein
VRPTKKVAVDAAHARALVVATSIDLTAVELIVDEHSVAAWSCVHW